MKNRIIAILTICSAVALTSCGSYQMMTMQVDENPVDENGVFSKRLVYVPIGDQTPEISTKEEMEESGSSDQKESRLYQVASKWIGTPYLYGGNTSKGIDCSGFVKAVYEEAYNKTISRTSANMFSVNCKKIKKEQLTEGDLVFFRTDGKNTSTPNHVGIYLSNNQFIHASSSKGVTIADLTASYYVKCFLSGGRVK